MLDGKVTDYGDLLHIERWVVKGRRSTVVWKTGVPIRTVVGDRISTPATATRIGRLDFAMDLAADMKVDLSVQWTDELGNPVSSGPTDVAVSYTVDDTTVINLVDNGDGTATAAAVGPLGVATVHAEVSAPGISLTGDLQISVVAGLAERFNITAGTPTEVTPDTLP